MDEHLLVVVGASRRNQVEPDGPGSQGEPGDQGSGPPDQRRARRSGSQQTSWRPRADHPVMRPADCWRRPSAERPDRLGARLSRALRTVGDLDHGRTGRWPRPYVYAWPTLGVNARFCREPGVLCGVRASRWDRVGSSCRASLADWPRDWIGPMVAMSASKESRSITSARGDISAPSRRSRRLTGAHCHPGRPIITIISGMPGRPRSGACGRAAVGGSSGAGRCHAVRAGGGGPAGVRSAARSSSGWQRSRPAMVRASPAARAAAPASCRPVRYQAWSSRPWARW